MTRNFCWILRSIWTAEIAAFICTRARVICRIIIVTSISAKCERRMTGQFGPAYFRKSLCDTSIYAPRPAGTSVLSADEREKGREREGERTGGDFEISTGADLTLVENTDEANGRRTKELEARYNPRAVKDYEWLDWLRSITEMSRNAIGQSADFSCCEFFGTYVLLGTFTSCRYKR